MSPIVFKQSAAVQIQRLHSAAAAASLASGASGTPCVERWRGPVVEHFYAPPVILLYSAVWMIEPPAPPELPQTVQRPSGA
jgi:hypothetical protein